MADGIQLAVAIGVPLLTCGATVVWQLAHARSTREEHERRMAALETQQAANASAIVAAASSSADAYGKVLVHLADARGDVRVLQVEIENLASVLRKS